MTDIKILNATGFVQFCKDPDIKAARLSWDELDTAIARRPVQHGLPTGMSDTEFMDVLSGRGDWRTTRSRFHEQYHDFIDECYHPVRLNRLADKDIDKFLVGKPQLAREEVIQKLPDWLRDLDDAFLPELANKLPPHRSWDHKIELESGKEPPYLKNRPLSSQELKVVRKWLDDNLDKGFIRESRARCAAPLMLAAKPGGGVRVCQDYRGLNNITIKNRYPLPLIRETLDALCHAKVYTKLDIIAAFNKLRIAEGHEWKTAFITRFGLYESLVMPFGLCNAPAAFQHYINHTLHDLLDEICTAYLDDVLVYSANKKEHREHVRTVVKRLRDAGLQIDINKCEFETPRTKYLGLIITPEGLEMDPEKVAAIDNWLPPGGVKDLQKFLGFANFYRRFIRDFAAITRPLTVLLRKGEPWKWHHGQQQAFDQLKHSFTSTPTLAFFDYNRKTVLETDASDWASGGILSQYDDDGVLRPVAYFSNKHTAAECNYEIYDKELLAIIKCLEEWRPELQGTDDPVEIITDHKNLQYFTTTKALNQRQVRWSEFLSQFNFKIVYRPGTKAVRPDALSRKKEDRPTGSDADDDRVQARQKTLLAPDMFDPTAYEQLLENDGTELVARPIELVPDTDRPIDELIHDVYQENDFAQRMISCLRDPDCRQWPKDIRRELRIAFGDCRVHENRVYYRDRLYIPDDNALRIQIIYRTHSSGPGGHPGRTKTVDLMNRTYWWPRMSADVREYVRACELCIRTKSPKSAPPGFLQPLPVPFRAWSDISVDYITPLPASKQNNVEYRHILVVVCRLTKMRHYIAVPSLSTEDLITAFIARIYALHGCPDTIVSDRGSQFVSELWRQLSARLGIQLKPSSAYHPETDGQTERVNQTIEAYLRAFTSYHQDDWEKWLPLAEFASNNVTSETTGVSPFFANYGFHPRMGVEARQPCPPNMTPAQKTQFYQANTVADRFERILDQLKALARQAQQRYEDNANTDRADAPVFRIGDMVYVNTQNMKTSRAMKKLDDKWAGPYRVVQTYRRACVLELPDRVRISPVFHVSLLQRKDARGLPGQDRINEAERQNIRGRVLEREDGEEVEKWEFEDLLDCYVHDEDGHQYLVKWRYQEASWQPADDLRGQDEAILKYHARHPEKPQPPAWVKRPVQSTQPRRSARLTSALRRTTGTKRVRFLL
jgi:transposase InsO family protein